MKAAVVALAAVALLISGIVIGRYELLPMSRGAQRPLSTAPAGLEPPMAGVRHLDTSRLPLQLTTVPLDGVGQFASSEHFAGGALARVEQSLFLMDRFGHIFAFENHLMRRMDYGAFPDGIGASTTQSADRLSLTTVKALYLAYDPAAGTVYVSQQKFNRLSGRTRFNITAIAIDKNTLERKGEWHTVFETEDVPDATSPRGGMGGTLIVAERHLYFTIGDHSIGQVPVTDTDRMAQNPSSPFGKIYEHDLLTKQTRVRSVGHRNPQGLVSTTAGTLISTEHGPEGGDELNVIVAGGNYGWPYKTHGTGYGTFDWPVTFSAPGVTFTEALYAWVPSPAISAVIEVSGFHERWNGDLLVGSLKAQTLFRLRMLDGRVLFSESIWIGSRIRDLVQMPNLIALITDDPALVLLSVDEGRLNQNVRMPPPK